MTSASTANQAISAYLVPTPAGARFAIASLESDPRRIVLSALLRGGSSRPMPLAMLAEISGVADRKALGTILYQLQRHNWISGDVEPLTVAREPLETAVPPLLAALSSAGQGVIADDQGLCFAFAGYARAQAERLAAFSTGLHPLWRLYRENDRLAAPHEPTAWAVLAGDSEIRLSICPLYAGNQVFHLTLAGSVNMDSPAMVNLAALLLRRYAGTC
jgi:hypothetical protein